MRNLWTLALVVFVCLAPAFAQEPTTDERPGPIALIEYLGLTQDQLEALAEIQAKIHEESQPILEEIKAKRREIYEAMQQDPPDTNLIGMLTVEIEELLADLKAVRDEYHDDAVAVLDADQELLLAELAQALELQNEARQAVALNLLGGAGLLDRFRDRLRRRRDHRRHHDAPETDASL